MVRYRRLLWASVVGIAVGVTAGACGDNGNSSADDAPPTTSPPGRPGDVEPTDPAAVGLFPCGETPTSADDSVSVRLSLPPDLTSEAPVTLVTAMTDSAPAAINGKTRVQAVDSAGRVVTSSESIDADAPPPISPVPRGNPAERTADRALQPCPDTAESDIAGYIGIAREEGGSRLWVSDPVAPPVSQE
jgi:hypothetical protein